MKLRTFLISLLALATICHAQEQFSIPKEVDKELVGEWKVIKMGEGDQLQPMPEDRSMSFVFKADGKGVQRKGGRERAILWGADKNGNISVQWDQPGGNGDAMAGKWSLGEDGLELKMTEYEDGKNPGDDKFTLLLKRVRK